MVSGPDQSHIPPPWLNMHGREPEASPRSTDSEFSPRTDTNDVNSILSTPSRGAGYVSNGYDAYDSSRSENSLPSTSSTTINGASGGRHSSPDHQSNTSSYTSRSQNVNGSSDNSSSVNGNSPTSNSSNSWLSGTARAGDNAAEETVIIGRQPPRSWDHLLGDTSNHNSEPPKQSIPEPVSPKPDPAPAVDPIQWEQSKREDYGSIDNSSSRSSDVPATSAKERLSTMRFSERSGEQRVSDSLLDPVPQRSTDYSRADNYNRSERTERPSSDTTRPSSDTTRPSSDTTYGSESAAPPQSGSMYDGNPYDTGASSGSYKANPNKYETPVANSEIPEIAVPYAKTEFERHGVAAELDQSMLVNPVKPPPKTGWRKFIHTVTAGYVNLGDSAKVEEHKRLLTRVRSPLKGDYRIAVLSLKGGVGKTTTTVMLGGIFASLRGDRVIAIDANPDLGTLAQRAALPGAPTIRDLLRASEVGRYSDIRRYTTQADSRLEVIGSDRDPEVSEAFSEKDYRHAIDILQHHYNVILTDCGTGLMHSAMAGVLDLANTLILVTSPALDGAQSASATLDWLNHHGYEQLVSNALVVVSASHPGNASIDIDHLIEHFKMRTRGVHVIPFDRHLSEGSMIDLDRLDKRTYLAYLELAALVAHDFTNWHKHAG